MDLAVSTHDDGTYGLTVDGEPFEPDGELFTRDSIAEVVSDVLIWFGPDAHVTEPELDTNPSPDRTQDVPPEPGPPLADGGVFDEAPETAPETQE